jgi:hypothetical protein
MRTWWILLGCVAAWFLLSARRAEACAPPLVASTSNGEVVVLPANGALPFVPGDSFAWASPADRLRLLDDHGQIVPASIRNTELEYLLVPDAPLAQGDYVFEYPEPCPEIDAAAPIRSQKVRVVPAKPFPERVGDLVSVAVGSRAAIDSRGSSLRSTSRSRRGGR